MDKMHADRRSDLGEYSLNFRDYAGDTLSLVSTSEGGAIIRTSGGRPVQLSPTDVGEILKWANDVALVQERTNKPELTAWYGGRECDHYECHTRAVWKVKTGAGAHCPAEHVYCDAHHNAGVRAMALM